MARTPDGTFDEELTSKWRNQVSKKQAKGTDKVLFYEFGYKKHHLNKRSSDLDGPVSSEMLKNF